MSAEVCSSYPHDDEDDGGIELGLGLSIGGGLKPKEEISSRVSSSSSSSVNIPNSVVGWPPIRRAHRNPILGSRLVKVNIEGTLIGRKVDLNAHRSYERLAQTLEDMFHGSLGSSRLLLNGTSEFLLTYEDKDGDCMLVGDVPWQMFLNSVKRLRILRNSKSNRPNNKS